MARFFRGLNICFVCGSLTLLAGCEAADDGPQADSSSGVTLSDVDDSEPGDMQTADDSNLDPSQMLGKKVTIRGNIDEVYDSHTVRIDDDWDDSVLVVTKDPLPAEVTPGADLDGYVLEVTGTVAEFDLVEIEKETGWDLDPQIEVEVEETERMLIAATAKLVNRDE